MALNQIHAWLVAYDIADAGRLVRVHKAVCDFALPVQYSLYLAFGSQNQIHALSRSLQRLIDPRTDDVRIYRVPDDPQFHLLGNSRCQAAQSHNGDLPAGLRRLLLRLTQPKLRPEYTETEAEEDEIEEATLQNIGAGRRKPQPPLQL